MSLAVQNALAEINNAKDYNNAIIVVAPGNAMAEIPDVPQTSLKRYASEWLGGLVAKPTSGEIVAKYTQRYNTVMNTILSKYETPEFSLKKEAEIAGQLYGIDPIHIVAAIVGEHAFNVGLSDSVQEIGLKMSKWTNVLSDVNDFSRVSQCKEMKVCESSKNDYDKWDCYDSVWIKSFAGQKRCGEKNKNIVFIGAFFDPNMIGVTYGLGQLGPFKVLSVNDMVVATSGFPKLDVNNQKKIYEAVLDPRTTVHYIAAIMRKNIDLYRDIAHFDISKNPGLTATLYNLGFEKRKAQVLYAENLKRLGWLSGNKALKYPQVNYYGWLMNHFEAHMRQRFGFPAQ